MDELSPKLGAPSRPPEQASSPMRIGVLLCAPTLNHAATRHLVLALNREQHTFEYEFLPFAADSEFPELLCSNKSIDYHATMARAHSFLDELSANLRTTSQQFGLEQEPPDYFVVISSAAFTNNYYAAHQGQLSIIALGRWKRFMAPPSFLEFVVTLLVRESVAGISPRLGELNHLGTKGCLFDFTQSLDEARHKVLTGFVCSYCRSVLDADGGEELTAQLEHVLDKAWLGKPTEPETPAGVAFNLGYDLFITKGLRATTWESIRSAVRQEGISQLMAIGGAIVIAVLLVLLGLKS